MNKCLGLADDVANDVSGNIMVPCASTTALTVSLDIEPVALPTIDSGVVTVTGGATLTWTMDSIPASASMAVMVDYCSCEYRQTTVDFMTSASYVDDEGNVPDLSDLLSLTAGVTELCPTPAPTLSPTPSPTPGDVPHEHQLFPSRFWPSSCVPSLPFLWRADCLFGWLCFGRSERSLSSPDFA